jgi:hypothetical protein
VFPPPPPPPRPTLRNNKCRLAASWRHGRQAQATKINLTNKIHSIHSWDAEVSYGASSAQLSSAAFGGVAVARRNGKKERSNPSVMKNETTNHEAP